MVSSSTTDTSVDTTAVLVVGGSLVGLSAGVFLAALGVPTIVVEKHSGSAIHPRAIGYTTRTMELFRSVDLDLPPVAPGAKPRRARVHSLAGPWFQEYPWSPPGAASSNPDDFSPEHAVGIAQDRLEPVLRDRAVALGADIRLGTELVEFDHDEQGVTATLKRRSDGSEYRVKADYLVAADGADSGIRRHLGLTRSGRGLLSVQRSILFHAPALEQFLRRGVVQFEVEQSGFNAFLTTYQDGRWVLMLADDRDYTPDEQRAVIRRATGINDLAIDLITTGRWELSALIAERFSCGRVFLVGDAAHQLPPNRGGYGANTGIEDAHNLAWKLAAAHSGISRPTLLDTYDSERRPIAWLRHRQIFARADYKAHLDTARPETDIIGDVAMELGALYRSAALPDADPDLPDAQTPEQWAGQPGTRAPHLWITENHSTLDDFGRGWTLVTDSDAWRDAAGSVERELGVGVDVVCVGPDDEIHPAFTAAYGIRGGGASLIRPDGYVAWRATTPPTSRTEALTAALTTCAMPCAPRSDDGDRLALIDLTMRYADAVNRGYNGKSINPGAFAQIFAADAVFDGLGAAPTVGAAAIAAELPDATAHLPFAMHAFLNPVLTIDRDTAAGTWLMWVAADGDGDPRTAYLGADLTYTRTPAGWRVQSITVTPGMRIPSGT